MSDHKNRILLAGAILLCTFAQAFGQEAVQPRPVGVVELRQQLNEAYASEDYQGFYQAATRLHEMRPNNAEYMYQLVLANALLNNRSGAYDMMLQMQQQGLSYDFDQAADTESIRDTEVYDYVAELLRLQGDPMGFAEVTASLSADTWIPTGMAWDESRSATLIGTAHKGQVLAVSEEGEVTELINAGQFSGMWGVFGVLADPGRNRLWVTTAANSRFEGFDKTDAGRSALFELKLDSLEFVKRYPVPVDGRPHRLGQLTQTPNGDLFLVDGVLPIVYRLPQGADRMAPYMAAAELVSLRGITHSSDGNMLYVADYELGIAVIDLVNKTVSKLQAPPTLNLGGIEGMAYWEGHLVIIQNNNQPQRIMRLQLDDTGKTVAQIAPVAVALPVFDYPSYGVMLGDRLRFLANSHWGNNPELFKPVQVAETSISELPNLEPPDFRKFWNDYAEKEEQMKQEGGEQ